VSSIVFFDPVCPAPYDSRTLASRAMAGTEASVTRIADSLGAWVQQHNRTQACGRYQPPRALPGVEQVVLIREPRALPAVRALYPRARLHLWLHDKMRPRTKRGRRLRSMAGALTDMGGTLICVSETHRRDVRATLQWVGVPQLDTRVLYNPVDDALRPDGTAVDPDRLVFFSSPNKGLAFALDAFAALRRALPGLTLLVGNPGYKRGRGTARAGVQYLGPQPPGHIHAEVRRALATFHPNFIIPETFGLVYAESHALGTPVLTHDFGAALEVVGDPRQVLPVTAAQRAYERMAALLPWRGLLAPVADRAGVFDAYIERIRCWRAGDRPRVAPDPRFALSRIAGQWRELLGQ